ncbi:MAG: hypothetical protein ACI9VM_000608, partial [Candidatus Azotimanducaceae bacterium]
MAVFGGGDTAKIPIGLYHTKSITTIFVRSVTDGIESNSIYGTMLATRYEVM